MSRPQLMLVSHSDTAYSEACTAAVWISHSNTWQRVDDPIYHRISDLQQREHVAEGDKTRRGWDVKTTCGATTEAATWLDGPGRWESTDYRHSSYGARLPIRWAMQFARPCRRCWP